MVGIIHRLLVTVSNVGYLMTVQKYSEGDFIELEDGSVGRLLCWSMLGFGDVRVVVYLRNNPKKVIYVFMVYPRDRSLVVWLMLWPKVVWDVFSYYVRVKVCNCLGLTRYLDWFG